MYNNNLQTGLILIFTFDQLRMLQAIQFADWNQNIKVSDMKKIRKDVIQIKVDCGNLCDTSIRAEKEIHKGKNNILIYQYFGPSILYTQ